MSKKISKISALHIVKLILRSLLFITVLVFYILDRTDVLKYNELLLAVVWIFFVVEMLLRFFPSKLESMGCQKQFERNYEPISDGIKPTNQPWWATALVALLWLALNAVFGVLYYTDIIDAGILIHLFLCMDSPIALCLLFPAQVVPCLNCLT